MGARGCWLLLLLLPASLLFAACERQTQYSILTTVFTGVPPMEELYGEAAPEKTAVETLAFAQPLEYMYQHPLWQAGQCTACHLVAEEDAVNPTEQAGQNNGDHLGDTKGNAFVAAPLLLPADKLCSKCHLDKTARRAIRDRLWLHNPVALGNCLACHAEHQSPNLAHLRLPPAEICASCHKVEQLPEDCASDTGAGRCLGCHTTHMGKDRRLLSSEYTEVKIMAAAVAVPPPPPPAFSNHSE